MKKYDLIVIGGGAGGLTVAAGAASLGGKVALIEKEEQPGGDCLHFGCVPSKALIEIANRIKSARTLEEFGVHVSGNIQMEAVMKKVKEAIDHIQVHDDADRFRKLGVDVYIGVGAFHSKNEVIVNNSNIIYGKRIVISTGSRPFVPPIPGLKENGFITNETIFSLSKLPRRLLVLGGGPIGMEMAQAMARLGSDVTVVERSDGILVKEDKEVQHLMKDVLSKEMKLIYNTTVKSIEAGQNGKVVHLSMEPDKQEFSLEVDEILVATGRTPNSDKLQLNKANVQTDDRGNINVNERLQTNIPHIYAIGDVNGTLPFTHVAGMEGKQVVQNALIGLRRKIDYSNVPWVTYTSPEVFHLGLTEEEAKEKKLDYDAYKVDLSEVDRFVTDHQTTGFVKIITDKKGKIIGAHAVGNHAGDWMQEVVFSKQFKKKIGSISNVIHPYPNHSAAVQRTADAFWRKKLFGGFLPKVMEKYIRWFR
ncbi:NAD(P)-binding protein [Sutcliffiella horikoshii]|uniref:NAD(P)-binding protein n=1 Tax=Sutcliffiella horikoshii TaxID=79883 RepID=A0A5D4SVZ3_9BACI|nr:FAD-dependent oxidoreductase [Sutcliffiella horikoshii]TYS67465.1 NAD(P)-binding protein [Sutcliffiella horikoshii]